MIWIIIIIVIVSFFKTIRDAIRIIVKWERKFKELKRLFPPPTKADFERYEQIRQTVLKLRD